MSLIAWQATVQDDEGNVIVNPSITVRRASDDGLADIFDADGVALANPFEGSTEGFVQFFAQPGRYTVQGARGGSVTQTWTVDLSSTGVIYVYTFADLTDLDTAVLPDGQVAVTSTPLRSFKWTGSEWRRIDTASVIFRETATEVQYSPVGGDLILDADDEIILDADGLPILDASEDDWRTVTFKQLEPQMFSGDGVQTTYTLTVAPSRVRAHIDGLYQSPSNYTITGSDVAFSEPPPNGTEISIEPIREFS